MTGFYLEGEPYVDPARLVGHYCSSQGVTKDDLGIKPVVLGTFSSRLTRYLAEVAGATRLDRWSDWKDDAFALGDALSIVTFPIGAPVSVAMLEEMYVCGMRTLITTGAAGSLQATAPVGTVVVPASAIREEGTSHHYAPADTPAVPDEDLASELAQEAAARGIDVQRGINWTTDAIYMEHKQKIELYRAAGVITVDMELSALFTVAAIRGVRCAAIVAVSDELHGEEWNMGFGGEAMIRGMMKAARVALTVASRRAGVALP
ncbi:MAG: nucleoside phosphorylase [Dehalococcoidia bacterium]